MKVLVVDDEAMICEWLQFCISQNPSCQLTGVAHNGQEALELFHRDEPDLILTDIKMPVMSGIELLGKIRTEHISEAWFVLLSGYADFNYAQQAIAYKCTEYILKPVLKENLMELLHRADAAVLPSQQWLVGIDRGHLFDIQAEGAGVGGYQ